MLDTQVNKASGFSFELTFPQLPKQLEFKENKEFVINIFSTVIPGVTLDSGPQNWQGGVTQIATGALTFEPWYVDFMIDSEFKNWKTLYKWFMFVNNNKDKYIDDHSKYAVDATLKVMDNFQNTVFLLYFIDVWPTTLNEVGFSYREGEINLEAQVTFTYDRYELKDY